MKIFYLSLVLFITLLLNGCINDDTDKCPVDIESNFILKFRYMTDGSENLFAKKIKKVDVFVFKEDGKYVMTQSADLAKLTSFAGIKLNLAPGNYKVICWGNASNNTFINPLSTNSSIKDAFVAHISLRDGTSAAEGDTLYYAVDHTPLTESLKVNIVSEKVIERIIDFRSAFIKVQLYIKGFVDQDLQANSLPPIIELTNITGGYDFEMQAMNTNIHYSNSAIFENILGEKVAKASFNTFRFKDDNPIMINIKKRSNSSILTTIALKDFMKQNNITVEGIEKAIVPILIEYKETAVKISIPEWWQTPIDPEL